MNNGAPSVQSHCMQDDRFLYAELSTRSICWFWVSDKIFTVFIADKIFTQNKEFQYQLFVITIGGFINDIII